MFKGQTILHTMWNSRIYFWAI